MRCGYFLYWLSVLAWVNGDMTFLAFASSCWAVALLIVAFGIYLLKYRIAIDAEHMSFGAYFERKVELHDVVNATRKKCRRSAELILSLRTGRKILFSGMLSDFDTLTQKLSSCATQNKQKMRQETSSRF